MSPPLFDRSPDLCRLRDEGFEVEVRAGFVLLHNVPYVTAARTVARGTLVSDLTLAGDRTARPTAHVVQFTGEQPCTKDGIEIAQIVHSNATAEPVPGVVVRRSFSNKPPNGYSDYYEKMSTYAAILAGPAQAIDPTATPKTFAVVSSGDDGVFQYVDTASSRAGITSLSRKLERQKLAIVGLGGTGSYVLDFLAKTPVEAIHLFDGDRFLQHNAFRTPGAPSVEELRAAGTKAAHFRGLYSRMHRGVVAHEYFVEAANVHELRGMDFVFICVDRPSAKRPIVAELERSGVAFVDVGMGVSLVEDALIGMLRVTASTPAMRDHVHAKHRIAFHDAADDEYARNIQIAELNSLNAALAVVKWKKLCGFYQDLEREHSSVYAINTNQLTSDDST